MVNVVIVIDKLLFRMFGRKNNLGEKDEILIEGLLGKETIGRQRAENALFAQFDYFVKQGVIKHRINEEESLTAYIDSIIQLTTQLRDGRFKGESSLKTYLFQIFNRSCIDLIRKKTTKKSTVHQTLWLEQLPLKTSVKNALSSLIGKEELERTKSKIKQLGDNCYRLLMAWGEGFSLEEIAKKMGLKDAQSAKSRKYYCVKKLRDLK